MHDEADLLQLTSVIRRVLRAQTSDRELVEDLTQDTLLRVAVVQPQLNPDVLRAYSIVTARNALTSHRRRHSTAGRHEHRLIDLTGFDGPEHVTLQHDETDALAIALDRLDPGDRQLLLEHEVDDRSLGELAATRSSTPGAVAMRLSRARAQLRVEFVLAFRRLTLPTSRCRPVLMALSAGDAQRQATLHASRHLLECDTCAELVEPVAHRRRGAAGWLLWPFAALGRSVKGLWAVLRRSRALTIVTTAVAAVAMVVAVNAVRPDVVRTAPPDTTAGATSTTVARPAPTNPAPTVTAAPTSTATTPTVAATAPPAPPSACSPAGSPTGADTGCILQIEHLRVTAVPADEGFWVTGPDGPPMWVQLVGAGESPARVTAGQVIAVRATVTAPTASVLSNMPAGDADRLSENGFYLAVAYPDLAVD